jgi:hypothetical protein
MPHPLVQQEILSLWQIIEQSAVTQFGAASPARRREMAAPFGHWAGPAKQEEIWHRLP